MHQPTMDNKKFIHKKFILKVFPDFGAKVFADSFAKFLFSIRVKGGSKFITSKQFRVECQ